MVTLVGTQANFLEALIELVELEYDAVQAYQVAIKRVKNQIYKEQLTAFLGDHERHIQEFSTLIAAHGGTAPEGPDIKQHLLKAKVNAASMMGDHAVLRAIKDNEKDMNKAYERLNHHAGKWQDSEDILMRGFADEKRHQAWLETVD